VHEQWRAATAGSCGGRQALPNEGTGVRRERYPSLPTNVMSHLKTIHFLVGRNRDDQPHFTAAVYRFQHSLAVHVREIKPFNQSISKSE